MKIRKNLTILGVLIILITIALIGISLREKKENSIVVSAEEVHNLISEGKHFYNPADLEKNLKLADPNLVLIDLRAPDQFLNNGIEGAVNIPFQRILDDNYKSLLHNDQQKILYAGQESRAVEVWILLSQMDYDNIYILKGDLPYWLAKVENKDIFGNASLDDEKARHDFKKELSGEGE